MEELDSTKIKENISYYLNYFIIGIVSFVAVIIIPFISKSVLGMNINIPKTPAEWIIFIISNLTVATVNVTLFACFRMQAKVNIKNDKNFIKANEILQKVSNKVKIPRSPSKYNLQINSKKTVSIFISSLFATFAFSQAILGFDVETCLGSAITVIMGIVFGLIQMKKDEEYWTEEYLQYAFYVEKLKENNDDKTEVLDNDNHKWKTIQKSGRAG